MAAQTVHGVFVAVSMVLAVCAILLLATDRFPSVREQRKARRMPASHTAVGSSTPRAQSPILANKAPREAGHRKVAITVPWEPSVSDASIVRCDRKRADHTGTAATLVTRCHDGDATPLSQCVSAKADAFVRNISRSKIPSAMVYNDRVQFKNRTAVVKWDFRSNPSSYSDKAIIVRWDDTDIQSGKFYDLERLVGICVCP